MTETREGQANAKMLELPIIPLRQSVLFPNSIMPFSVGRPKSILVVTAMETANGLFGTLAQRQGVTDDPELADLFDVGVTAKLLKAVKAGQDGYHVVLQGIQRFRVVELVSNEPHLTARVELLEDHVSDPVKTQALTMNVRRVAR